MGNLGDPARIVFEGAKTFPVDELRGALRVDLKYQAASRPSCETSEFLRKLEARIQLGYRNSGFPEATAHARLNTKIPAFVVEVEEGRRFRQGEVIVQGADTVDVPALRLWLAEKQQAPSWVLRVGSIELPKLPADGLVGWISGEMLVDTPEKQAALHTVIRWALADQGLAGGSFHTRWEPADEPGVADLVISFIASPQPTALAKIEVNGLKRDSQEQLLEYLEVAQGDRANGELLRRLEGRLTDSCRYWQHKVSLEVALTTEGASTSKETGVTLVLELEEFSPAPPLDQPLSAVDEVLRKSAAWINRLQDDNSDIAFHCQGKLVDAHDPELAVDFRKLVVTADGRVAADIGYTSHEWVANHGFIITRDALELFDWTAHERFCVFPRTRPTPEVRIQPIRNEEGGYGQNLYLGFALKTDTSDNDGAQVLKVHAVPVAMVSWAHRPNAVMKLEDGKLTYAEDAVQVEFDADSGTLLSAQIGNANNGSDETANVFTIRVASDGFDLAAETRVRAKEFVNRYDSAHKFTSTAEFVLDQYQRQPVVQSSPEFNAFAEKGRRIAQSVP